MANIIITIIILNITEILSNKRGYSLIWKHETIKTQ